MIYAGNGPEKTHVEVPMKLKRIAFGAGVCMIFVLALNGRLNSGQCRSSSIGPVRAWNTFLGVGGEETGGKSVAVDGSGNMYITGYSHSTWGNPIRPFSGGPSDAFVAKLDPNGAFLWNTFLGGNYGDSGIGIAVDGSGNVYIAGGSLTSWGNPIRSFSGYSDAFVAKLDPSGVLLWNTFLGGDNRDDGSPIDYGEGIVVDGSGNVYIAGDSNASWGDPIRSFSVSSDAFVAQLDTSGTLRWNTFLGGSESPYSEERAGGIAVDSLGDVYVTGESGSSWGNPIRPYSSYGDAFAAKLDSSGGLLWNTFLGGNLDNDAGRGIAVDRSGNVYVTGYSYVTWGNPICPGSDGSSEAFVAKLDFSGVLQWNTFHGGIDPAHPDRNITDERGEEIAVDGSGNIYFTGTYVWGVLVFYELHSEGSDAVVAKLDSNGVLQWDMFLGRDKEYVFDYGHGIAVEGSGNVCITGQSDSSWGNPIRPFVGGYDNAFVAKIVTPSMTVTTPAGGEAWNIGTTQGIHWTSSDLSGNVNIQLLKGTSNLGAIATGVPARNGAYPWRAGYLKNGTIVAGGSDYRISVVSAAGRSVKAISDGFFSLIKSRISVTSPVNGTIWNRNSVQRITWTYKAVSGAVDIFLYRYGVLKGTIASAVPVSELGYSWTVGALNNGTTVPVGAGYSIAVKTADKKVVGKSRGTFTIRR
jgi:hypothetical protein